MHTVAMASLEFFARNVNFVVLLTRGDLVLPLAKYAATARRKTISRMSAEKECEILAGKLYMPW